jgi:hypothetical protein
MGIEGYSGNQGKGTGLGTQGGLVPEQTIEVFEGLLRPSLGICSQTALMSLSSM